VATISASIAEIECELIVETLIDQDGSRTNASKILGISLRTLRNKIREYRKRGKILPEPRAH
jgi:DNA-binding NtrC family response regulator